MTAEVVWSQSAKHAAEFKWLDALFFQINSLCCEQLEIISCYKTFCLESFPLAAVQLCHLVTQTLRPFFTHTHTQTYIWINRPKHPNVLPVPLWSEDLQLNDEKKKKKKEKESFHLKLWQPWMLSEGWTSSDDVQDKLSSEELEVRLGVLRCNVRTIQQVAWDSQPCTLSPAGVRGGGGAAAAGRFQTLPLLMDGVWRQFLDCLDWTCFLWSDGVNNSSY